MTKVIQVLRLEANRSEVQYILRDPAYLIRLDILVLQT
jgi:hypothetical protein